MTFDSYPRDVRALELAPGQSGGRDVTPVRFGAEHAMDVRLVRLARPDTAGAPLGPAPELTLQADGGTAVAVPADNTATDLPSAAGGIVATATYRHEADDVYLVRVFSEDADHPPTAMTLRLTNADAATRAFRWVVSDVLAQTAQPRVLLPPAHLDALSDAPATGEITVVNVGTGPLHLTAAAGTDLGAGFTLVDAPTPVPANGTGRLRVAFAPPPLPPGASAVVTTTHSFVTDDAAAQDPGAPDARVALTASVRAPRWQAGDVLVVDPDASDGTDLGTATGALVRVDPATGRQTVVSAGQLFTRPSGVAVEPSGDVLVADSGAVDGNGAVIRVDRVTGVQTLLSSGNLFRDPGCVVVTPQGLVVVADSSAADAGRVLTVHPVTGVQAKLVTDGPVRKPYNLAVDDPGTGSLVVLSLRSKPPTERILRIAADGTVTPAGILGHEEGIAVDDGGRVLLFTPEPTPPAQMELAAYRPDGTREVVSTGQLLGRPFRLRRDGATGVLVLDWAVGSREDTPGVIRVGLADGVQTLISVRGALRNPLDLVVVPAPPA